MKKLLKTVIPMIFAACLLFSCSNSSDSPTPTSETGNETQTETPSTGDETPQEGESTGENEENSQEENNPPEESNSLTLQYALSLDPIFPKEDCTIEAESEINLTDGTYTCQQWSIYDSWGATYSLETQELIYKAFTNEEIEFLNQYIKDSSSADSVYYSLPVNGGGSFIYKFSINEGHISVTAGEGLNEVIISNEIILKFLKEAAKYDSSDIGILDKSFIENKLISKIKFHTSGDFLKTRVSGYVTCLKNATSGFYNKPVYLNSDSSKFYFQMPWSSDTYIEDYYIEKD